MFADFTKVGYCAICGRKVKAETMCKFCADYESRIAKLKDENVILKQEIKQLEEQCEKLIENRDNLTIRKDKELEIYKLALEKACKKIAKLDDCVTWCEEVTTEESWSLFSEEILLPKLVKHFLEQAKAEVENDKYGTRKED